MTIDLPELEANPLWSATPTPLTEEMEKLSDLFKEISLL